MKHPNGYGTVYKLSGKRRKPFVAAKTFGWEYDENNNKVKQIQKPIGYFATRQEAMTALAKYNENPYDLDKETLTIEQLYERWTKGYFEELTDETSIRTIKSAWGYVTPDFRSQNATSIAPQTLKDFITLDAQRIDDKGKLLKPSDNTKSRMKSMFNLMYDYAVLSELMQHNPARQFTLKGIQGKIEKNRKDKNPIILEHENILWNDIDFGYTKMVLINIYSGWRPEELLELEKSNIDFDNMVMVGGLKTEAGFNRVVPIHPKILDLVKYYYDKSQGDLLFYDYDGANPTTMTYDKYRGRFKKILKRHKWEDIYSPSCPRHTFATKCAEVRMEEYAKKSILGHEISDVTYKHYTHLDMVEYLTKEMSKII